MTELGGVPSRGLLGVFDREGELLESALAADGTAGAPVHAGHRYSPCKDWLIDIGGGGSLALPLARRALHLFKKSCSSSADTSPSLFAGRRRVGGFLTTASYSSSAAIEVKFSPSIEIFLSESQPDGLQQTEDVNVVDLGNSKSIQKELYGGP